MNSKNGQAGFEIKKVRKDLVVIGAGMPGIVAAVQAARLGLSVALINNRGYLGGNASAEIRVPIDGANSCSEFNFYALEGGILHEILLENLWYNPQGNPYIWDATLRDFLYRQKNIELFLDTCIDQVAMVNKNRVSYVAGSQQGSENRFEFYGDYFLDDTGDGTVGYLAGAEFRVGREAKNEFNERIAPEVSDEYVILSTLAFHGINVGKPVKFKRPDFALDLTKTDVLEYREIPKKRFFSWQWYYEIGEKLDQIKESQEIIKQHYQLVYGIWDYIKNSGDFDSENYDLAYVSCIPGKRESRRLMGDYVLSENDLVYQKEFEDAVGHGGRAIDLHALEGFFSKEVENWYYLLKGIYQIPYRCGYSKDIDNLFFAGRCMSHTHVAFGSDRVMGTLCTLAQALGAAAYLCKKEGITNREVYEKSIKELQQILLKEDHFIPGRHNEDAKDKMKGAKVSASSTKKCQLSNCEGEQAIEGGLALVIPTKEKVNTVSLLIKNEKASLLRYSLHEPEKKVNWGPDREIGSGKITLESSQAFRWVEIPVNRSIQNHKLFIQLSSDDALTVGVTTEHLAGVVTLKRERCSLPRIFDAITLEKKEYLWQQMSNPFCFKVDPEQNVYAPDNVNNGYSRPYGLPNLWISDGLKGKETLEISFPRTMEVSQIIMYFDADLNTDFIPPTCTVPSLVAQATTIEADAEVQLYAKASRLKLDSKNVIPTLVKAYSIYAEMNGKKKKLAEISNNYQRVNRINFDSIQANKLEIEFTETNGIPSIGVYEIRVY